MGFSLWRTMLFFIIIGLIGFFMFPSKRELGYLLFETGRFEDVLGYLQKHLKEDPEDIASSIRYLSVLSKDGDRKRVEEVGKDIIKKVGDDLHVMYFFAKFYEDIMDLNKASYYWEKILKLEPNNFEIRDKFINYCKLSKSTSKLIDLYHREYKKHKGNLDDYYALARLYELRGDINKARVVYERIAKKFEMESYANMNLVQIYALQNKKKKALKLYRKLMEKYPDDIGLIEVCMDGIVKHGKPNEVEEILEKWIYKVRNRKRFLSLLVDIYIRLGKNDKAIALLQRCRKEYPSDYEWLRILGDLYINLKEYAKAIDIFNKYLKQRPENYEVVRILSELYFTIKEYNKAANKLGDYHEKTGGDYRSHHLLGDVYAAIGFQRESQRAYRTAIKLIESANN